METSFCFQPCNVEFARNSEGITANSKYKLITRSPEAPASADIHLHVSQRPASTSVCMCTPEHMGLPAYM